MEPQAGRRMARKADVSDVVLDAALELAATAGWRDLTMRDVAEASGVTLAELHAVYPTRSAILKAFSARIDAAVLAGDTGDLGNESPRDRLFDVIMRRLDVLSAHRKAAWSIIRASLGNPGSALQGFCLTQASMRWMLEAAGIDAGGPAGALRTKGLMLVWLDVLRVWQSDESEDMARTMAHLDRRLALAERLQNFAWRAPRPEPEEAGA